LLQVERLKVSSRGVAKFLKQFRETGKEVLHNFTLGSFDITARNHCTSGWQWQEKHHHGRSEERCRAANAL